jgi:hypothetical protein
VAEHIVDLSEPDRTRQQQVAAFYAQHAAALQRTVARRALAPEQTIEDACQNAWATLLRHPEVTLDRAASRGWAPSPRARRGGWPRAPARSRWAPTCPATPSP